MNKPPFALWLILGVAGLLSIATRLSAEPPTAPTRAEVEAILSRAPKPPAEAELRVLNVLLLADDKDHGLGEHDYPLWQKQWQRLLGDHPAEAPKVHVATASRWPTGEQLVKADLLVMYCYPGTPKGRTFSRAQIDQLAEFVARGGGFVPMHSATYTVADLTDDDGKRLLAATGLMFDKSIQYRHGPIDVKIAAPAHPICLGLPRTLRFVDEPYWPPTGDLEKVQVLATSDETIERGGEKRAPQPLFWTHAHGRGRVFGCVLGHYASTFDDPYFRILLLRGMAWAAGESAYRFDRLVLTMTAP